MEKSLEIKLMILENFIDYLTHNDEAENKKMKDMALQYVEEDHVDEIIQSGFVEPNKLLDGVNSLNDVKKALNNHMDTIFGNKTFKFK